MAPDGALPVGAVTVVALSPVLVTLFTVPEGYESVHSAKVV
jgi:hypothetical protein